MVDQTTKRGIACQKCGCTESRVLHTRRYTGRIVRERACVRCGKVTKTTEQAVAARDVAYTPKL